MWIYDERLGMTVSPEASVEADGVAR